MEDTTSVFADWVTATARALGYRSDAQLADALSVQQSTVTRWRKGSQPQIKHLVELSKLFKMKIEPLLVLSGHVPPELLSNATVSPSPEPQSVAQRMIEEAKLPSEVKEVFRHYWQLRLKEEWKRLSELMNLMSEMAKGDMPPKEFEKRAVSALDTKVSTHLLQAVNQARARQEALAQSRKRARNSRAHEKQPPLQPGDVVDITIRGVGQTRICEDEDNQHRFELLSAEGKVVLRSGSFKTQEEAEAGLEAFFESFATQTGYLSPLGPDTTEE
ncbi:hypothetical protein OG884_12065 [Streptosporangium sp. NBC_01755]|uniref:helix-turn-helix domain-containing protein n=1 Tax=Streptosporangium sp. NBC_01755 TaxID=2975949 RepID=UPI002DDA6C6E|nr:helix-turn-helix domain-containing protein [Streptosporangium sp. NBC_01755]WSD02598.1 hypothetical protein OG884_12065 [Streptosporangium sp. NBC_01755]